MTIVELIEGFKNRENKRFNNFLNEVANYVMYEQAMIKKIMNHILVLLLNIALMKDHLII